MALKDDLIAQVTSYTKDAWPDPIPKAQVVPTDKTLTFGNTGRVLDACVLYADLHRSTEMVDKLPAQRAAEYYKSFLHCAAKIISSEGGTITAYDGDRIMAIYMGTTKVNQAVDTAFKLNWAVLHIINAQFQQRYGIFHRQLRHTVGIDQGEILAAKTGVRSDNDIVWVGPAANYASKLNSFTGLDIAYSTRITARAIENCASRFQVFPGTTNQVWDGSFNNVGVSHYRSDAEMPF